MKNILAVLVVLSFMLDSVSFAYAETEDSCAIWLCLPGGFPTGCAAAYSEFKHRIKKGKPPLPKISACTTGPNGENSDGNYQMGDEYFFPCKNGLEYSRIPQNSYDEVMCVPADPQCNLREKYRRDKKVDCTPYKPERRKMSHFIKIWMDGKYLGQFFYQ